MLSGLENRFDFLVSRRRGGEPRHQTLRMTLDWSYLTLPEKVQRLFRRLSVFRGGWTAEAAASICEETEALDILADLCDCSLIFAEEAGPEMRFRMLETVREYAAGQCVPAERVQLEREHARFFVDLAERAEEHLTGAEQADWLERLEWEHDNLRAALDWCQSDADGVAPGLALAGALWRFWFVRGHLEEARQRFEALLTRPSEAAPEGTSVKARAKVLKGAGNIAWRQGNYAAARASHEESLRLQQELGDKLGVAASLHNLGIVAGDQNDLAAASTYLKRAINLWQEIDGDSGLANSLSSLGKVRYRQGDFANARRLHEQALLLHRRLKEVSRIASARAHLGDVARHQGDYWGALAHYQAASRSWRSLRDKSSLANCRSILAELRYGAGNLASAKVFCEHSLRVYRELGERQGMAYSLARLGWNRRPPARMGPGDGKALGKPNAVAGAAVP